MADNTIANAIKFLKGEEKSLPTAKTEGQVYFAYKNVGTAEKPSYTGAIYIDTPIGGTQNRIKMTANADIADKAFNDSAGLSIRDTYLNSLGYTDDGKQTILIKGSGNNQTRIALPIASTTKSGIVTTDAQSFGGTKTFTTINSTNLTVTGTSGFNYSGIETATESKARPIWFADSSVNGKPVINTNFTYNPATQTLKVLNLSGTAEKATKDSAGNDIRNTYVSDVTISGRTITVTKGSGTKVTLTTQDTDTWRGIQNNLTSDSTTDSLSAAQGKYLKNLIDGKSNNGHNHDDRYYTETEINSKLANYLPLSGGTLTGALNFANNIWNVVGDDVAIGDMNIAGTLGVMGKNGNTAIKLVQFGASTTSGDAAPGVAWICTGNGTSTISGILSGTFSGNLSGNASTATNVAWSGVTGKPSTFTPSSHDHSWLLTYNDNTITSIAKDTTTEWGKYNCSVHWYTFDKCITDQPSQYGFLINFVHYKDVHQLWLAQPGGSIVHRGGNINGWSGSWSVMLDSYNYTFYTVTKSGLGASGTWGINISGSSASCTGNSTTATKLQTTRTIFGRSFDGTSDISGQAEVFGSYTTPENRYFHSGIQIRENDYVGANQSDIGYAPSIGFHWGGRIAATLLLHSDGNFYFKRQNGLDKATIDANLNGNATGLVDAFSDTNTIKVGWNGAGLTSSKIHSLAAYSTDAVLIKDAPKSAVREWLGPMPASDVYSWAKASSKPTYSWGEITGKPSSFTPASHTHPYLPLVGGTMSGTINFTSNKLACNFRPESSAYCTGIMHQTNGNEALVFAAANAVTSFIFKCGQDPIGMTSTTWTGITPSMQIKKQSVYINSLIANNVTPAYNLYVNGTTRCNGTLGVGNGSSAEIDFFPNSASTIGARIKAYNDRIEFVFS